MDLLGQQGNGELVNSWKMGVKRPRQLGNFADFRIFGIKLSFREAQQERFFNQYGAWGCSR